MSVWLPLTQRAPLISGISGEGQMPRQNRLEVTPPPAHAHSGQTKAQITAQGANGRGVTNQGYVLYRVGE